MLRAEQPFIPKHVCQFDKQIKLESKLFQYSPPVVHNLGWPPVVPISGFLKGVQWQLFKYIPSSPQDAGTLK